MTRRESVPGGSAVASMRQTVTEVPHPTSLIAASVAVSIFIKKLDFPLFKLKEKKNGSLELQIIILDQYGNMHRLLVQLMKVQLHNLVQKKKLIHTLTFNSLL